MKIVNGNKDNFDSEVVNSKTKVLVDFNASWCGPCRMIAPILEEISNENDNIKIVSIDVDEEDELSYKYGVSSIPCLVLFENGKEKSRAIGFRNKDELMEFIGE